MLTFRQYNYVKKAEHMWKGMGGHESQISPIPPDRYGDRFVRFISGITMSRERAEKERLSQRLSTAGIELPPGMEGTIDDPILGGVNLQRDHSNPEGTEKVMQKAERAAEKSRRHGANEDLIPDRSILAVRGAGDYADAATLPVIGEAAENASNASRTANVTPTPSHEEIVARGPVIGNANVPSDSIGEVPPPTPPKLDSKIDFEDDSFGRRSWGGGPPPTPPKDDYNRGRLLDKNLPLPPVASKVFSASPSRMV